MNNSFIRFLLVGIINTIIGLTFMYVFLHIFSCSFWVSTFIGNFIGAFVSYFLNRTYTFQSNISMGKSMIKFGVVILLCYIISYYLGEKGATILLSHVPFIEKKYISDAAILFGTGIYTITNYVGQRLYVFQNQVNMKTIMINQRGDNH